MNETASVASPGWHLLTQGASSAATRTDTLFVFMVLLCGGMAVLIAALLVFLCVRYREGATPDRRARPNNSHALEIAWTVAPLLIFLGVFTWAAHEWMIERDVPADAMVVQVVGKQWMWHLQHANGRREINALHVPLGQPVALTMASQDAIHSFFVPAFRLKQDVVPGRMTRFWFTATRLGEFHIFCAEYCGSEHSGMVGTLTVMPPAEFARWLEAGPHEPGVVQQGLALFSHAGCSGCHAAGSTVIAPPLTGVYGRMVRLADGRTVRADEEYLRDSIVQPRKDVVAGYAPVMPSYAGRLDETQLQALIAWMRAGAPAVPGAEDLR